MGCRICGDESSEYRARSGMVLCAPCHAQTPAKVTFAEFVAIVHRVEGMHGEPDTADRGILREFYSDYKTSTYGDVRAYWASCSA